MIELKWINRIHLPRSLIQHDFATWAAFFTFTFCDSPLVAGQRCQCPSANESFFAFCNNMSIEAHAFRLGPVLGPMLCSWYMTRFLCLGKLFMVMQVIHDYLCSSQRVDTASLESHLAAIKNLRSNFLLHSLDRKDGCVTCHIYIKNSLLTPVGGMCLCSTSVLHQRPGSLRILRSILAVLSTAHFWTETSDVVPAICWSHSSSLGFCSYHHWDHFGLHLPCPFQFLFQSLVLLRLLCVCVCVHTHTHTHTCS